MKSPETISIITARRYILGKQGLWPGRRWEGKAGTAQALRRVEAVQIDPINVLARSHDLVLHSRVDGYRPDFLGSLLYEERRFFDWGGGLFIFPMEELPYWRVVMQRKGKEARWAKFAAENPAVLNQVRAEISTRGPLGNRDFEGSQRVNSYRARKDTGLALYYLWLTGELMTHSRRNFERLYDLRERVAPPVVQFEAGVEETEHYFAKKALSFFGLCSPRAFTGWFSGFIERKVSKEEGRQWVERLLAEGAAACVQVEGWKDPSYLAAADLPLLEAIQAGHTPEPWQPVETTTREEVAFLAPLDIVSARGRAKLLFDFDYIWEVYKPAEKRRWGYYTLPILFGDALVARIDPKLDRQTGALQINGFWLENEAIREDPAFVSALSRGLSRLARFLGASRIEAALHAQEWVASLAYQLQPNSTDET
jgi:uncharacterized protein YcaQ